MIREHYDAVAVLMPMGLELYRGSVQPKKNPDGTVIPIKYPYAVLWGDLGTESSGGMDGDSLEDSTDVLTLRPRVTYVGESFDSVLIICRNVRAALNHKTPTVAGWAPSKLRQSSLMDIQTDTDVTLTGGGNPVYAVDEFALVSVKL